MAVDMNFPIEVKVKVNCSVNKFVVKKVLNSFK